MYRRMQHLSQSTPQRRTQLRCHMSLPPRIEAAHAGQLPNRLRMVPNRYIVGTMARQQQKRDVPPKRVVQKKILVTPDEETELTRAAEAGGSTFADWARRILLRQARFMFGNHALSCVPISGLTRTACVCTLDELVRGKVRIGAMAPSCPECRERIMNAQPLMAP